MNYSKLELKRISKLENKDIEDHIKFNIINFIHTIHLNKQDFVGSTFNSEFFGDLGMTFQKNPGQIMGLIRVKVNGEGKERLYIFTKDGYELLDDLLALKDQTAEH